MIPDNQRPGVWMVGPVGLLAAILFLPVLAAGCGLHGRTKVSRKNPHGGPRPDAVASAAPEAAGRVVAPGIVEPWGGEVGLAPQESGRISAVLVHEGQRVESDQLLATLDDGVERAALDMAKADMATAEAFLAKTYRGATAEAVREAMADAEVGQARASLALTDAERLHRLGEGQAAPRAEVQRADAEAAIQRATAAAVEARRDSLLRGPRAEDRSAARAGLASASARFDLARAKLASRQIRAPQAAVILLSRFHVGELFTPGAGALLILGDLSRLQVRLEVDEIDALRLSVGADCELLSDHSVRIATGAVFRVAPKMGRRGLATESPTARADVRVREVFVALAGPSGLVPGQRIWGYATPGKAGRVK